MPRRSAVLRALVVLLALVQAGAPPLAALADAWRYRASATPVAAVHIEERGGPDCPSAHLDHCALCAALSHVSPPPAAAVAIEARRATAAPATLERALAGTGAGLLPPARAPPTV